MQDQEEVVKKRRHCVANSAILAAQLGCLLTLKSGGNGLALGLSGLQLASKLAVPPPPSVASGKPLLKDTCGRAGSEASTVMSARRCPLFLSTIGSSIEVANQYIRKMYPSEEDSWIQIRRFHILREDFTEHNGMLVRTKAINRPTILSRYEHIIEDMFSGDEEEDRLEEPLEGKELVRQQEIFSDILVKNEVMSRTHHLSKGLEEAESRAHNSEEKHQ
ncbi:hypothetical protein GUITHDRAFT_144779 [Guillardia theta CCMP2712]|uniref:Uncharacterized protein n=1 Tax=Guillardia theta (strain CCMP2712) TaxID=905079 RepID=L1IMY8_GUITC|nr:hypothetical protein GUITHDRAFT_144779 [Guillardia theta CCMP2712]EKX37646.1 hypothetical protein GUITHDRAFT_144779 [Guillardia theta CCMP2712]|eukprot:XP_005824626.1 hypothetical protein GUITHDRAFT_144779 [Guillardia theta CCMP2712]